MRTWKLTLIAAPLLAIVTACSGGSSSGVKMPQATLEADVASRVSQQLGVAADQVTVACAGDLDGTAGATVTCDVTTAGGESQSFVATTTGVDGSTVSYSFDPAQ